MDPIRHRRERGTPKNTWCSDLEAVTNKTELHLAGAETLKLIPKRLNTPGSRDLEVDAPKWVYTWHRNLEVDTKEMEYTWQQRP